MRRLDSVNIKKDVRKYSIRRMVEAEARVFWVRELILLALEACEYGSLALGGTVELVEEEESVVVDIAAIVEVSRVCEGRKRDVLLVFSDCLMRLVK